METAIINVCAAFAPDEKSRLEAIAGWQARGEVLDIMYDNIPNLYHSAELETKNFIYAELMKKVYPMVLREVMAA